MNGEVRDLREVMEEEKLDSSKDLCHLDYNWICIRNRRIPATALDSLMIVVDDESMQPKGAHQMVETRN